MRRKIYDKLLKYKGYSGSIEFTPEDNCLFGKVLDLHRDIVLYEGNTIDELRKDFEEAVDFYLESCRVPTLPSTNS